MLIHEVAESLTPSDCPKTAGSEDERIEELHAEIVAWRGRKAEAWRFGPGRSQGLGRCGDVVLSSGRRAALQLLKSFSDQLLKLLHLRGVSLHLVLRKLRLKCQSLLEILCLGDLVGEREN